MVHSSIVTIVMSNNGHRSFQKVALFSNHRCRQMCQNTNKFSRYTGMALPGLERLTKQDESTNDTKCDKYGHTLLMHNKPLIIFFMILQNMWSQYFYSCLLWGIIYCVIHCNTTTTYWHYETAYCFCFVSQSKLSLHRPLAHTGTADPACINIDNRKFPSSYRVRSLDFYHSNCIDAINTRS